MNEDVAFLKNVLYSAYQNFKDEIYTVSDKGAFDLVTTVDQKIERFVWEQIQKHRPEDHLHGEEFSPTEPLCGRTWILDPIDGTFNFASKSQHFGLQGALWDNGTLKLSVIYLPLIGELYEAERGEGAFCNTKRIRVSDRKPKDAIVSFGDFPHARPIDAKHQKDMMERAFSSIARYRMFGAASVDFAMLASGKTEGVVLFTKNKWDIAPGLLLASEAGALICDEHGDPYSFSSNAIVAVNTKEMKEVLCQ